MSNHIFTGSGVALITPMKSDGSVNYDVLGDLVEFHVQNGTDAIIVCGTTGEAATLSEKEHCETISFVAEKTNGRIPVIAGTGSNDTSTAVMLSKSAASTGVDALLCVTPYYNKTSQQGLVRHFNVVADSVDIPIILYNVPSRTGCNIKPKTYQELCKHPNIVAAKEASGDISQLCLDNDFAEAQKLNFHYLELMHILFSDVNPIPVKTAMNLFGYEAGECRLPLVPMSVQGYHDLKDCMEKYDLLSKKVK